VRGLGNYDQALELLHGASHADTLNAMYNLAILMRALGRYEEGESLYRTVLEGRRRLLGDEHLHTLSTMTSLANLLTSAGQFAKAEQLQTEALSTEEHVETLRTINSTGEILIAERRYDEAGPLLEQNAATTARVLGDADHESLRALGLAVQVSWETGREEESRERVRRLIGLHRTRLESMPDNANFSYDLANLLLTCRPCSTRPVRSGPRSIR
jgi:tetratricopeptide (TPR) repeat protein